MSEEAKKIVRDADGLADGASLCSRRFAGLNFKIRVGVRFPDRLAALVRVDLVDARGFMFTVDAAREEGSDFVLARQIFERLEDFLGADPAAHKFDRPGSASLCREEFRSLEVEIVPGAGEMLHATAKLEADRSHEFALFWPRQPGADFVLAALIFQNVEKLLGDLEGRGRS